MKILSIETSCDETAISIVEVKDGANLVFKVLGNAVASQIELHAQYGGVFPMMAKREHAKNFSPLLLKVLKEAKLAKKRTTGKNIDEKKLSIAKEMLTREEGLYSEITKLYRAYTDPKIDALAVTTGPGLEPTLWVGISAAKALATLWNMPVIPTNHMEGHMLSVFPKEKSKTFKIEDIKFPALSLLVSGGHTEIVHIKNWGKYKIVGRTRDDAAGEAFDKAARMLGLPYPGGPEISKLARISRMDGKIDPRIKLPRPMMYSKDYDFSFSGLKTAVLYLIRDLGKLNKNMKENIAREFEDAVVEVLVSKTMKALSEYKAQTLIVGGGVAASTYLREKITQAVADMFPNTRVMFPTKSLSTDNSLMIAIAGYMNFRKNKKGTKLQNIKAEGNLSL